MNPLHATGFFHTPGKHKSSTFLFSGGVKREQRHKMVKNHVPIISFHLSLIVCYIPKSHNVSSL